MNRATTRGHFFKTVLIGFMTLFIVYTTIFYAVMIVNQKSVLSKYKEKSYENLESLSMIIESQFDAVVSDLIYLSRTNEVDLWKIDNGDHQATEAQKEFLSFSQTKHIYDQLRLIDAKGEEAVRVNLVGNRSQIVPKDKLQNKADRYYFQDIKSYPLDKVYMSPFDLNVEHGAIENPIKPVIRFGMPLYSHSQKFAGALFFNYLGDGVLDIIKRRDDDFVGDIWLLNKDGYWLYSSDEQLDWGCMYDSKKNINMLHLFPSEWKMILSKPKTQNIVDDKLWSSLVISALSDEYSNDSTAQWILVYSISYDKMGISTSKYFKEYLFFSSFILPFLLLFAIIYARIVAQRDTYEGKLIRSALYDGLTQLANRNLLHENIDKTLKLSKRHGFGFALLFIDLDDFKAVNDTYGHRVGDELLKQVARRILGVVRASDTVSRYGGDEFIVLLSEITDEIDCENIAQVLVYRISDKFFLGDATVEIGASIGVVVVDAHSDDTPDEIIKKADRAMYGAKKSGKNRYEIV